MRGALQTIMSMLSLTQTMGIEGNKYVAYGSSKMLYAVFIAQYFTSSSILFY